MISIRVLTKTPKIQTSMNRHIIKLSTRTLTFQALYFLTIGKKIMLFVSMLAKTLCGRANILAVLPHIVSPIDIILLFFKSIELLNVFLIIFSNLLSSLINIITILVNLLRFLLIKNNSFHL